MSSSDVAIRVKKLNKCYQIYHTPHDRLKQFLYPRVQNYLGKSPKQYFNEFWALKDVSFEVKKGETVGIIGRNGSGKSTLLQIICGTLYPTNGNIQTNGRIAALLELGSGFNSEFTGRENVYLYAAVLGLSRDEVDKRFNSILEFADIGQFIEQPIKTYSSGMVVRLAFAVAVNVDPEILIVDEALSVGDELFQRKCFSRIEAIKNSGATILFVSHSAATIVELCDRAILLHEGEFLAFDDPKLITTYYQKLLYVSLEHRDALLANIRKNTQGKEEKNLIEDIELSNTDLLTKTQSSNAQEYFEPKLVSKSRFEFESHGVRICNPFIETITGNRVNNLVRNEKYRFRYSVKFDQIASFVRFGMLVKTTSGFPLGGALSAASLSDGMSIIESGSTVIVEFSFKCHLNAGHYFLNAGVFGIKDKEEIVLHRIVDAVAFRVLPKENSLLTEIVDFEFVPEVTVCV